MNILIINHYAGSQIHGMEFRPYYLAREWVRMGHKVQIVAGAYSHIRARQPKMPLGVRWLDEILDGIAYRWYATPSYRGNGVGRVYSMVSFLWHLWRNGKALARDFKPDVVIASSTYPMDIWPARRIAKAAGARLVFEVHDLWPLSPMELGGMSKWHPFILWVQMAEDYAYRHADKVVSMLPKAQPYMQARGMAAKKFFYVPNGVDEEEWTAPHSLPAEVVQHLQKIRGKGLPIVGYSGTHGLANALDDLLSAAQRLEGRAEVVLVGTGPERERLLARVREEHLSNVHMLPAVAKQAVPNLLEAFDITFIGSTANPLYRFGISPNKLMDYMFAAKPVVMAIDAGNDPVGESGCGITVRAGDVEAIIQAVLRLTELSTVERETMGQAGRAFILRNQTYAQLAQRFLDAVAT
ncbi:glycosyltransferase family 4 protein [Comamonas guangdongensis]|uniref:Glycosyltransferase family 4 protein n=1 Tax=Comamonas guangdongensis TaxID=510515 RepID=A0ABV3ZSP2_9BURK